MQLSARNQLPGAVTAVKEGAVMAEIVVKLDGGPEVVQPSQSTRRSGSSLPSGRKSL